MDLDATGLFQVLAQLQQGRMLDHGGNHLVAPGHGLERREDGGIVALRPAGGEDDLVIMLGADQRLYALARLLDGAGHIRAEGVHGGSIAELLGKKGQHGGDHGRIDAGGGIVVEIDGLHRVPLLTRQE